MKESILFITFNRPKVTRVVFEAIRNARPPRLYLASDGPRINNAKDLELITQVREIITQIDWPCEIKTLFRDKNLGCKYAVSTAIDWFFDNEERGIILEDDCLPHEDFFGYCEDLLEVYQFDNSVFLISGENISGDRVQIKGDYAFVRYPCIWGWASWSRAWKTYDSEVSLWPSIGTDLVTQSIPNKRSQRFWKRALNDCYHQRIDTWDYQVFFAMLVTKAKCIVPQRNLISNLGFGDDATHTKNKLENEALLQTHSINFPLRHIIYPGDELNLNQYFEKNHFNMLPFSSRLINKFIKIIYG